MARKNPRKKISPPATEYYQRYVRFSELLHNNWMQYELYPELYLISEEKCKEEKYNKQIRIECSSPVNPERRAPSRLRGYNIPGFIKRLHNKDVPETIFVNSVSLFEAFVSDIAKVAYVNDPQRFLMPSNESKNQKVNEKENIKLLKILIKSKTREEAIERYVEERLRGIFYDNPIEVFTKNKLRFGFKDKIKNKCEDELNIYSEAVARRNIIVHNLGKVDQKYLREVENTDLKYNGKITIEKNYLFNSLKAMNKIAKVYVKEVVISVTGEGLPQVRM